MFNAAKFGPVAPSYHSADRSTVIGIWAVKRIAHQRACGRSGAHFRKIAYIDAAPSWALAARLLQPITGTRQIVAKKTEVFAPKMVTCRLQERTLFANCICYLWIGTEVRGSSHWKNSFLPGLHEKFRMMGCSRRLLGHVAEIIETPMFS